MFQRLFSIVTNSILVLTLVMPNFKPVVSTQQGELSNSQASSYLCENSILYDFDASTQGWQITDNSKNHGAVGGFSGAMGTPVGQGSLLLNVDLKNKEPAEFIVDLVAHAPTCAGATTKSSKALWEPGSILSVWVWAPIGARGDSALANGVHLFAEDGIGRRIYGTWQNIQENTWFEVTLRLGENLPACGSKKAGFDPSSIKKIGLNIALNRDKIIPLVTTLQIAGVAIRSKDFGIPTSDHLYDFDAPLIKDELPHWQTFNQSWDAAAYSDLQAQEGSLIASADFVVAKGDSGRKGVIGIIYAPPLNLSPYDEATDTFSVDVRFESSALQKAQCPFVLTLWAYDKEQNIWYSSDQQNVGATDWIRVSFPLSGFKNDAVALGKTLDLSQISQLSIQIWANIDYQGKVWFDNISLAGKASKPMPANQTFVEANGPNFQLNGSRFRFVGANAEYLPYVSDEVVEDVFNRAQSMGITVIRTWGFGDGCEDKSDPDCAIQSRYFHPRMGVYNDSAFEHFDRIVMEAKNHNIRLIVPLVNNWPEYGGIPQYVCWLKAYNPDDDPKCSIKPMVDSIHDRFYDDPRIKSMYRLYVNHFVNHMNTLTGIRYADDPTIMAWELINEPRARSDPSGNILHNWIAEMSSYLAGVAPHQLIGTGEEGWYIMSQDAVKGIEWQTYPYNYWHYGVNWIPNSCVNSWGSNGADFMSDNSSLPQSVNWQASVGETATSPVQTQERIGVPSVDYTTIHLYPAPGETNLPGAPYCDYYGLNSLCTSSLTSSYHQSKEWISQHVKTSHDDLKKPFILEEFNFPLSQAKQAGDSAPIQKDKFRVSPQERARLFTQYLDLAYRSDVDGVLFWNLGYMGFADQSWNEVSYLRKWEVESNSDSIKVEFTNRDSGSESTGILLEYDPNRNFQQASMLLLNSDVDWLRTDGSQVTVNLNNSGDAKKVTFTVQLSDGTSRPALSFPLVTGMNTISLDDLFALPSKPNDPCPQDKQQPPLVSGISATLKGYTKTGSAYFDFQSTFNNRYVIYPGDPVENVLHLATKQWQENLPSSYPVVKINTAVTCGSHIESTRIHDGLPIEFTITNGLEHPDGYFYRYEVTDEDTTPQDKNNNAKFGSLGLETSSRILIQPVHVGYNKITVAAEGVSFDAIGTDASGRDSCGFWVDDSSSDANSRNHVDPTTTIIFSVVVVVLVLLLVGISILIYRRKLKP
jgi:endo-1,4-beta-mannosidase